VAADPELSAYVGAIEAALTRQLGREHVLSPPDFNLARGWHAAGLPLAIVVAGLERAIAAGFEPRSLLACRRFVESGARAALAAGAPATALPALDDPLLPLAERLEGLAAAGYPGFAAWAALARDILAESPGEAERDPKRVSALARGVAATARAALGRDDEERARAEAGRALRRQPGLPDEERAAALERHLTRRALERLGLSRLP